MEDAAPMVPDEVELADLERMGHREFVGGLWEEIGALQFDYLVAQGLRPEHVLLDIGCGALRGGCRFIAYLDRGNYLGIDRHAELIARGVADEVGPAMAREKAPELIVSPDFEFGRFTRRPDFALAQSLFTHLTPADITRCLSRLREVATPQTVFFASFHEVEAPVEKQPISGSHVRLDYTAQELLALGRDAGWKATYVGEWDHPQRQRLIRYQLRA